MTRALLLASAAAIALAIATPAAAQDAETAIEVALPPPPPPQPRGILGGLFKRKQRPVAIVVEAPPPNLPAEAPKPTVADAAPIDLVPPDAAMPAVAEEMVVASKPTFVLRKVPDADVPLPRPSPRRTLAPEIIVVAPPSPEPASEPVVVAVEEDSPYFEPEIPPPAMAAEVREPDHGDEPPADETPQSAEPVVAVAERETAAEPIAPVETVETVALAVPEESPAEDPGTDLLHETASEADPAPLPPAHDSAVPHEVDGSLPPAPTPEAHAASGENPQGASDPHADGESGQAATEPPPLAEDGTDAASEADERMAAEVLVAGARAAESPREIVEFLIRAQDAIAAGSVPALAAQRRIRAEIDRVFADADPSVWQEPTNTVAAATYVFSGGTPDVLRGFATLDPKPAGDERLWRGALAYVEGRQGEAAGMLLDLDIGDLPSRIGGQVALAQAALVVGTDPRRALERLDMARLVAPGTLVEEAAIRRSLLVTEQLKDQDRFEMLVRQYLARFRHSIYAGNFRYRFAAALSRSPVLDDPAQFPRLDALLEQLGPDARRSHYLTIASAAVVSGMMAAATYAAERALALASPESPDLSRARLYRSAALVLEAETFEEAETEFARINVAMLDPADRALHAAIEALASSIRSGVDPEVLTLVPASGPMPGDETAGDDPLLARAKALSGEVDLILADAS